jgi:hypothetical protein
MTVDDPVERLPKNTDLEVFFSSATTAARNEYRVSLPAVENVRLEAEKRLY